MFDILGLLRLMAEGRPESEVDSEYEEDEDGEGEEASEEDDPLNDLVGDMLPTTEDLVELMRERFPAVGIDEEG